MTAPEQRAGGLDSNARGIAVLAIAVVIGVLLLWKAGDNGSNTAALASTGPSTTIDISGLTSTTLAGSDTTTTTQASDGNQPSDVKVLVLNGSGKAGVAKTNSTAIGQKGYTMLPPTNATANAATTSVYYAANYQADAAAIAALLGKTPDSVLPMPATPLGAGSATANVVVVLGADTAPASGTSGTSGSSTSTSSTSTTSPN